MTTATLAYPDPPITVDVALCVAGSTKCIQPYRATMDDDVERVTGRFLRSAPG